MPLRCTLSLCCALVVAAAGCASPTPGPGPSEVVLPLHRAWVEGRSVEYVTTDISDATMARALGVNHVPRLADALPAQGQKSLVERVYKFADDSQISVFQSAPLPTGGNNADPNYSPLWRMVLVRWADPRHRRELRSEEAILAAADLGHLSLAVTDIVVNCPITRSVDGAPLSGVR